MAETFATVGPLSRVRTSTRSKTPNAPEPTRKLFASTRRDGKVARYKRRELLGKGSFAEVWKADDRKAGHQVALKIMKENDDAAQFEYQITKDLDHMNIIKVLSSIQSPKQFIIVQELAEGGELFNKIVPDVGLDEYQARRTLSDMLDAIDYLSSKGIVHTDIKPENIVLGLDGRSKLCDFGLAEYSGQLIMRRHGTEPYMPPEVLKNPASHVFVHTSWDTWSLGVVLFVMMVGDFPWERAVPSDPEYKGHVQGGHVHRGWRHFSQALVEVLDSMLTNEPGQRCTTANVRPVLSVPWKRSSISRSSSLRRSSNKSLDMKVDTSSDITMCSYATTCTGVSQMSVPESVPDAEFGFDEEDF